MGFNSGFKGLKTNMLRVSSEHLHLHLHLQHKLIEFYNRDEKCLQRGTDWAFK